MLLHIDAFRHRSFYTKLLHREVFTQTTLLHTEAFTHRGFYTQLLHTKAFTHKLQNRNFTQVFAVGPSFCAKRLHPKLWNRNFTALYAVGPSFRAKRLHPKLWNRNFTALYAVGPSFRAKRLHPKLRAKRKMKMENVKNDVLPIGFGHFVEVHSTEYCACHEKRVKFDDGFTKRDFGPCHQNSPNTAPATKNEIRKRVSFWPTPTF